MITQERVTSINGSRVQTDRGQRRCAGNELVAVGDMVTVIGELIVGWVWRSAARPVALRPQYYRFADAAELKMHRLNLDFVEMDTEDIARPAEDTGSEAVLVLHCYNENVEYLVWFIGSRCLIQRDGATVADFTSVFPAETNVWLTTDAYIDIDENLVWVGGYQTYQPSAGKWAKYVNGQLIDSVDFSPTINAAATAVAAEEVAIWDVLMDEVKGSQMQEHNMVEVIDNPFPDYDHTFELLLWQQAGYPNQSMRTPYQFIEGIDLWGGFASYTVRQSDQAYLTHIRKITETNNAFLFSLPEPVIVYYDARPGSVIVGYTPQGVPLFYNDDKWRYYVYVSTTKTTKNHLLYRLEIQIAPQINWEYNPENKGLFFRGTQTYTGVERRDFTWLSFETASKNVNVETKDETGIETIRFSHGPWKIVARTRYDGSLNYYLTENGVDVDYWSPYAAGAIHATDEEIIIVFRDYVWRKKAGEQLEQQDYAYFQNLITKRFTGGAS